MPATAENLRDLHALHHRAKALRDRMISEPKTLEVRKGVLTSRHNSLDEARKALQEQKVHVKKLEHSLQGIQTKIDDLKLKRNKVRKNEEYKAIQNQLAHDENAVAKLETEILEAMIGVDEKTAEAARLEGELKKTTEEVSALEAQLAAHAAEQENQLRELEAAIAEAESIIPIEQRDQYRRNIKQRADDAFASVSIEDKACSGCFVAVTPQTINELITCHALNFCKTCGRILYLAEEEVSATRRKGRG